MATSLAEPTAEQLSAQTLEWLRRMRITAYRTDRDGDIAVVSGGGDLTIVTQR